MAREASGSAWWSPSRGLPPLTYRSWRASVREEIGAPQRLLAWAATTDGFCVGSPAALSYGAVEHGAVEHGAVEHGAVEHGADRAVEHGADRAVKAWQHLGWHQIQRGGWDADSSSLRWTEVTEPGNQGREGSLALPQPGRLPELFRERVAATIAVERFFALSGARGVIVTARRDLGRDNSILWHASLTRGLTWEARGVREAAERAVAALRSEYDIG